jgi:hypothetical protein
MRYVIEISMNDADDQSIELSGLPVLPLPGDTVQTGAGATASIGVVRERHFAFEAPDLCRVSLACKRL